MGTIGNPFPNSTPVASLGLVGVTGGGNRWCHPSFSWKKMTTFFSHRHGKWWPFYLSSAHHSHLPKSFIQCSFKIQPQKINIGLVSPPGGCHPGRSALLPLVTPLLYPLAAFGGTTRLVPSTFENVRCSLRVSNMAAHFQLGLNIYANSADLLSNYTIQLVK